MPINQIIKLELLMHDKGSEVKFLLSALSVDKIATSWTGELVHALPTGFLPAAVHGSIAAAHAHY